MLEAERWGDEFFQAGPRGGFVDAAFLRDPDGDGELRRATSTLTLPRAVMRPTLPLMARMMALRNRANDEPARADLAALPAQLERIDRWVAEGLLGGERPNAADLQIGSTLRLLMTIGDVRPLIEAHPCARLVAYFPAMQAEVPAGALPADWLAAPAAA